MSEIITDKNELIKLIEDNYEIININDEIYNLISNIIFKIEGFEFINLKFTLLIMNDDKGFFFTNEHKKEIIKTLKSEIKKEKLENVSLENNINKKVRI